ncbi:hypothetical protein GALMADRAFT_228990 [Galerina marginata CBS 339.88]|uniref:Uncharacterized protein n=1 Tax=Galerina marginata (strain CBS 339.88) TaxID=685588 RepID=A0A067SP84_GALM3|nr:hypothetical protein GALMADRAFT_228990 [Galerina marginata CBS 339.88]
MPIVAVMKPLPPHFHTATRRSESLHTASDLKMSGIGGMLATRDPNQPSNVRRRKRNLKQIKRELGCPTASQKENKTISGADQLGSIGGTSIPAASPGASIFRSPSSNIEIHNGQFNATAGNHISVVINAGGGPLSGVNAEVQDNPQGAPAWQPQDETRMATEDEAAQAPPQIPVTPRSSEIYYRHLATKGRGSPLWIPEPNKALRIEYQRSGMRIGDVGIINSRGNFDFLFNICLPLGHPINPRTMPEHFAPLWIDPDDIQKYSEFKGESYLSSGSIKRPSNEAGLGGLLFESSASEGAILTMPVGSNSEDLGNVSLFRRYAALHAENWYNYVNLVRGREAGNGDIRLVTGFDKTSAWGMATFSNMSDPLQLAFRPKEHSGVGQTYDWEYSGAAEVRAGPETKEMEELKRGDPAQVGITYENQCLFVRTLNIRLQDTVWKRLASQFGDLLIDDGAEDSSDSQFSSPHSSPASGRTSASSIFQPGSMCAGHGSRTVVHDIPEDEAKDFVCVSTSFPPLVRESFLFFPSAIWAETLLTNRETILQRLLTRCC